ncbi:CopD family protein [Massilia litorea]|uniref:CopD family protein n=1 Tax=Massilia litorea TaxID=2769491 RepID=A0A7L9UCN3_9BURK|nr:CopD family protein [Massilia litorea]QOL52209.1 CopD family protein [Massilia litorea]
MDGATLFQAGSSFVVNLAFAILVGALCTRWLLRGAARDAEGAAPAAIMRIERWAALPGAVGAACGLWAAAAVMGGVGLGEALSMLAPTLGTAYGQAGLLGLAALVAAALLVLPAARGGGADALLALALLVWSVARVSVSHAVEDGLLSLGVLVEWLHLVLVALWLGLVAVGGLLVLPRVRSGWPGMGQLGAYLERVSTLATVALAGILVTGMYNAWHRLGSLDQLFGNLYGNALALKLVLVALAVALGGYNKLFGFPALAASLVKRSLVLAVLRIELVILVGALAAAVVLTSNQPPGTWS